MVLDGIGEATHSGIGSCGPYGDAAGLIVGLGLVGFLGLIPASVYLTRLALRREPRG